MMFYKTCFTLLDSFGYPVKRRPTLFHETMLDDVLRCFTVLDGPLVFEKINYAHSFQITLEIM